MLAKCEWCGTETEIRPARAKTFRFCSYACRGKWRAKHWIGKSHPGWTGGKRTKKCQTCDEVFSIRKHQPITQFKTQKFCCKECADEGGFRYSGQDHYNWQGGLTKRPGKQAAWARKVISRDMATCQKCGSRGVELHAHHIKPFLKFPKLRWDVRNGIALCCICHWNEHSASDANGVKSGKPATGKAGGNPEPSLGGNIKEGVTTRGRAYRRWNGNCSECGKFISRRLSDVTGKSAVFCDMECRGKWTGKQRKGLQRSQPYGSNFLHERPARKG